MAINNIICIPQIIFTDLIKWCPKQMFGPSYFVRVLVVYRAEVQIRIHTKK